jgi:threonine-phosphate decarboxylase
MNFTHGGDIESFAKLINTKPKNIIDLSSNINFLKPNISINIDDTNISFYKNYTDFYKKLSKFYGIKQSNLILSNGASSGIFSLFTSLKSKIKTCAIYSPAYLEYKKAANIFDYTIHTIDRFDNIYQNIPHNSLVIFVNPSTPDGKYYKLNKLFQIWQKADATVIIDESFLEFSNKPSMIKFIKSYKKLYIIKSMTKIYSCAGVRVAAIISNKTNIKKLKQTQPQWILSSYDIAYIQEAIKDKQFLKNSYKQAKNNKKYLIKHIHNLPIIEKIYPSDANFIMIKLKNITADVLQKKLQPYKIMVRDCFNFDTLDNRFIRVAIKDKKSIQRFIEAIYDIKY